ncbi:MAG TPA: hypothetical protein VEL76_28680 [Gemmataceae bacterium]|nr:hypothetical protein [Gemmataceae bacterium]
MGPPHVLPNVRELIDRRAIPDPQPDGFATLRPEAGCTGRPGVCRRGGLDRAVLPHGAFYPVRPAQGFTLFEALDHPEGRPFEAGRSYRFRASYRVEAPVWYQGRLRLQPAALEGGPVTIAVVPLLKGLPPQTHTLVGQLRWAQP